MHPHDVITPEEPRRVAAAKSCRGFAVTPLMCRKRACSLAPGALRFALGSEGRRVALVCLEGVQGCSCTSKYVCVCV